MFIQVLLFNVYSQLSDSYNELEVGELPSWALGPFTRPEGVNPIITNRSSEFFCPMKNKSVLWEVRDTFNPAATVKNGSIVVLYRAEDDSGQGIGERTSRIGYAESVDGIKVERRTEPVVYPDVDDMEEAEWPGGCEDPRVVLSEEGLYVMLYTAWNRKIPRLAVATSRDLIKWDKTGLAFGKAYGGRFENLTCKSASIVTKLKDEKIVATKVNGKYFMYWGENAVCAATSENLVDWDPVLNENDTLLEIVKPRSGFFDSRLTECGPPSIMTNQGIVLIYNGKNGDEKDGDPDYPIGAYCAGQFLFNSSNPYQVMGRLDKPFFFPTAPYEKSGQYVNGTVFTEGLAYKNDKLFLYYGCADSRVAVAISDNMNPFNPKPQPKSTLGPWEIAGIVAGSVIIVAIAVFVVYTCVCSRKKVPDGISPGPILDGKKV